MSDEIYKLFGGKCKTKENAILNAYKKLNSAIPNKNYIIQSEDVTEEENKARPFQCILKYQQSSLEDEILQQENSQGKRINLTGEGQTKEEAIRNFNSKLPKDYDTSNYTNKTDPQVLEIQDPNKEGGKYFLAVGGFNLKEKSQPYKPREISDVVTKPAKHVPKRKKSTRKYRSSAGFRFSNMQLASKERHNEF